MTSYKAFFRMTGSPFGKGIPTGALLRYSQFRELTEYLAYIVEEGSIGLVTGDLGTGKSTAIRAFTGPLDDRRYHVCCVGNTDATRSVLRQLAWSYGMHAAHLVGDLKDDVHVRIAALWTEHAKRTILIVDEAQALGNRALQELRLLTSFACDSGSPLGLVLVGQPQLRVQLKDLPNEALDGRIMVRYHLAGLSLAETGEYIGAHLAAVGADPGIFTPEAIALIFQQAKGIPRRINKLAIQALIKAGHKEICPIDATLINAVIKDIALE